MAYISQDPNTTEESNTTNVLAPNAAPTPQSSPNNAPASTSISTSAPSAGYVSTGNPYGKYATPNQPAAPSGTSASSRKTTSGPSSGLQTNVQTYAQKNTASSQGLGTAVAGKLQNTSDIAKQNLSKLENKYQQGVDAGTLTNRNTALQEAQTGFTEAATAKGPERTFKSNEASMYTPTKNAEGLYSKEDQALVDANKARVTYGDGSTKEYATEADAQSEINEYNKSNPGYFTYGDIAPGSVSNDRLSEILNAEYKGPSQLSDISGYNDTYNKIQDVSSLQNQALKGRSKEELLNRTFSAPTGEYTKGSRLLDELLLGQGAAASTLKSTAEKLGSTPTGMIQDEFKGRNKDARQIAAERSTEITGIKEDARKALTETAAGRSTEVNNRINDVIKDWDKYPQYFKDRFKGELDKHNAASTKKQEYDNVAGKYGGAEAAKSRLSTIQTQMPSLDTFDPQEAIHNYQQIAAYDKALVDSKISPSGTGSDRRQQEERLYDAKQVLAQMSGKIDGMKQKFQQDQLTGKALDPGFDISAVDSILRDGSDQNRRQQRDTMNSLLSLQAKTAQIKGEAANLRQDMPKIEELAQYADYDPNSLDVGLSQLEAESLGVQGGEGLYNILKEQGVEGLIKTAAYDKNKLVSTDEQAQLARLQNIAQLAQDYGVQGSGVNVVNQYGNRDLAGQQTALSALDMDNFKRQLQGAEKSFRTDADASNISGTGTGSGSSRGLFGKKKASATQSVSQNFGDLLKQNNAYRNMYSDQGINKNLIKTASDLAKGQQTFESGTDSTSNLAGQTSNIYNQVNDMMGSAIDKGQDAVNGLLGNTLGGLVGASSFGALNLANKFTGAVSNALGGSSAAASGEANRNAYNAAVANLQANLTNKINTSGLKNQLSIKQNNQQDAELFKLLGLLDTTNL